MANGRAELDQGSRGYFGLGRPVGLSGARKGLAVRKDQAVEFWQRSGAKSAIKRRFAATASAEIRANAPWIKEQKTRKRACFRMLMRPWPEQYAKKWHEFIYDKRRIVH